MSLINNVDSINTANDSNNELPLIGVGLRHVHYSDALSSPADIDFIELHAENFFANGGITQSLLSDLNRKYAISLHATSLGLGSSTPIPEQHIHRLTELVTDINPILVSDHACFSWGQLNDITIHAGDLLPIPFNQESLDLITANINLVQKKLGRQLLVENLSAYLTPPNSTMSEVDFLVNMCQQTQCKLLLDLNNLMVNNMNHQRVSPLEDALAWIEQLPVNVVGEIHLAGCTPATNNNLVIDDHSQPVSDEVWALYEAALLRFGAVPTLIEWDLDLPPWTVLIGEATKARSIAQKVFACQ